MIEIDSVEIQNFMSWGDKQVVPLKDQGVVRIEGINLDEGGSNRAGKSVLVDAICWGLYNETIRGLKNDEVLNRFQRKDCFVKICFRVRNTSYTVCRYRKHTKFKNKLRFWRGDRLLSYRHTDETQKRLQRVLGYDFKAFSSSVVFGGTKPFASLTDADQKKVFESFLQFEEFDKALISTKSKLDEKEKAFEQVSQGIEISREKIKALQERIYEAKKFERTLLERYDRQIRILHDKIRDVHVPEQKRVRLLRRNTKNCEERLKEATKAVTVCEQGIIQTKKEVERGRVHEARARRGLGKTNSDAKCPTCYQTISEESRGKILSHFSSERKSLVLKLRMFSGKLVKLRKEEHDAEARLENLLLRKAHFDKLTRSKKNLEERLYEVRANRRSSGFWSEKLDRAVTARILETKLLLRLFRFRSVLTTQLEDLRFWETGFSNRGIKSLLIRRTLPALNNKLEEYTEKLFGDMATIEFVPMKENKKGEARELFHIQYSARRGANLYKGESAGGKRRVDICILLVLSWMSRTCNVLLVDELLDGLDEDGRFLALEILATVSRTVLVISHKTDMKSQIGRIWTVTKKNGISRLTHA